jgi:hypothetical protein
MEVPVSRQGMIRGFHVQRRMIASRGIHPVKLTVQVDVHCMAGEFVYQLAIIIPVPVIGRRAGDQQVRTPILSRKPRLECPGEIPVR